VVDGLFPYIIRSINNYTLLLSSAATFNIPLIPSDASDNNESTQSSNKNHYINTIINATKQVKRRDTHGAIVSFDVFRAFELREDLLGEDFSEFDAHLVCGGGAVVR
jgi:hypothetical protein